MRPWVLPPGRGPRFLAFPLWSPRLAALFALATELRARQGLNPRAQVVTLALDLLQLIAQGFALGLQPAGLDPQGHHRAALARVDADVGKKCLKTIDFRAQSNASPDTRRKSFASARTPSSTSWGRNPMLELYDFRLPLTMVPEDLTCVQSWYRPIQIASRK